MSPFFAGHATKRSERDPQPARPVIDWRALSTADRSCCCPARPAVVAIMPPVPGRDHPTDLLLCGHHYQVSRSALAAAGAAVLDVGGRPISPQTAVLAAAR
ncbi:MAG TPA: hypothetical protein VMK13_17200 [Streptosporangiaceae bacterium]|nr:hypothetical protein [Streptosporangiaceae bacterium]